MEVKRGKKNELPFESDFLCQSNYSLNGQSITDVTLTPGSINEIDN